MRQYKVSFDDKEYEVALVYKDDKKIIFQHDGTEYTVSLKPILKAAGPTTNGKLSSGIVRDEIVSPIPGIVVQILVNPGDSVTAGQPLVVIEAMKMENAIKASHDGTIEAVEVRPAQEVMTGQVLVRFK